MEASQRVVMMTAALSRLMVFFPNLTIANTDRENAAKLLSLAADPAQNSQRYTLHRYSGGLVCSGPITTRTTDVPDMSSIPNPVYSDYLLSRVCMFSIYANCGLPDLVPENKCIICTNCAQSHLMLEHCQI